MTALTLTGFADSVYTRAVRMALAETGMDHAYVEVNPFAPGGRAALAGRHPFGRVPVLQHGDFSLYETVAILGYLDDAFEGPSLFPEGAAARAQILQIESTVDAYLYWPLVRQVFSHGVYRPHHGEEGDPTEVAEGLAAAGPVLDALEAVVGEGRVLSGGEITRADCHLAPMIDAFAALPAAREMLDQRTALSGWFFAVSGRASFRATRPAIFAALEAAA